MQGILLFDKPVLWTSHDAVDFVRRRTGLRAVGHAGTLDPMATGLLVMLVGPATKWSGALSGLDKDYVGSMTLGITTDTQDMEGRILFTRPFEAAAEEGRVASVFGDLTGDIEQKPPAYSALKRDGRKLCDLARAGHAVEAAPRPVRVERFSLLSLEPPEATFFLRCSKGTYVRSLCSEAGSRLGCGAALSSLRRTRIGPYAISEAVGEAQARAMDRRQIASRLLELRAA